MKVVVRATIQNSPPYFPLLGPPSLLCCLEKKSAAFFGRKQTKKHVHTW